MNDQISTIDQDVQRIGRVIDERQRDQRGTPADSPSGSRHAALVHDRRASRPCGRANIMAMKKAKANT